MKHKSLCDEAYFLKKLGCKKTQQNLQLLLNPDTKNAIKNDIRSIQDITTLISMESPYYQTQLLVELFKHKNIFDAEFAKKVIKNKTGLFKLLSCLPATATAQKQKFVKELEIATKREFTTTIEFNNIEHYTNYSTTQSIKTNRIKSLPDNKTKKMEPAQEKTPALSEAQTPLSTWSLDEQVFINLKKSKQPKKAIVQSATLDVPTNTNNQSTDGFFSTKRPASINLKRKQTKRVKLSNIELETLAPKMKEPQINNEQTNCNRLFENIDDDLFSLGIYDVLEDKYKMPHRFKIGDFIISTNGVSSTNLENNTKVSHQYPKFFEAIAPKIIVDSDEEHSENQVINEIRPIVDLNDDDFHELMGL